MSGLHELTNYTLVSKYARWIEKEKRRETWKEAVNRVRSMMLEYYKDKSINDEINWAYDMMLKKKVLGSQRALQYGGGPVLKKHARIYNCFSIDTEFITQQGVKTFMDFQDGDTVSVLTHKGRWKRATVKMFGMQTLSRLHFQKNNNHFSVCATHNHRWLLKDNKETTHIQIGDQLAKQSSLFQQFNFQNASIEEQLYWCYGFVYGDGTVSNKHSMVRLCGCDVQYESRFTNLGLTSSSKYLKTTPNPNIDNPTLIRAFVRGYLDADGTKNKNKNGSLFDYIQSSELDHIEFIRKCFPIAGVFITSEEDLTGQETNFGIRPHTIKFRLTDKTDGKTTAYTKLTDIEKHYSTESVWCLQVDDDQSFVLPNGTPTGNCVGSYCDRPRFFQECFWLLLCGCGTGFSIQKHHVARLPKLEASVMSNVKTYTIPDTIEGWADAAGVLFSNYFAIPTEPRFEEYSPRHCGRVQFDDSLIRPEGSPLSSGIGKAPGPKGLMKALSRVQILLDGCIEQGQDRLRPIDCLDGVCHLSDAVLSGGVRRSSSMGVFSLDDMELVNAKIGNWREDNPQRARANISAILLRNETSFQQFASLVENVKQFGEPGFLWADDLELLCNPCSEIAFWCYVIRNLDLFSEFLKGYDSRGYQCQPEDIGLESGWQGCNLSTINCATLKDLEDFKERGRAASVIGTLQAGYTQFDYLTPASSAIFQNEALLGVSMTGMMEQFEIALNPEYQEEVAKVVKKTNEEAAKKIGINIAARTTCLKPEGTSSCLLGTSSSMHPHHSKRYLRLVQANKSENPYQHFKKSNPQACEESVWCANKTDDIIYFPVEVPDGAKTKNQLPGIELLKIVKSIQQHWVDKGKCPKRCAQPWLRHNVSNTINVLPEEWDEVTEYIYNNRKSFCGITLLSHSGDKDYPQAPFTAVYTPREIVREYGDAALWTSGLIEIALAAFDNDLWAACDCVLGNENPKILSQICKFADKYFDGNIRRVTYCMKDVYNWKRYYDLTRSFQPVDYTTMVETEDETKPQEEIACSGGACLI